MTRLTDTKTTAEITMQIWTGDGYTPDWSESFFDVGLLPYDEEAEAYIVDDVEYCIDQAKDWEAGIGEYNDNVTGEERIVDVSLESVTRAWKVYGMDGHRQALSFGESQRYDWSTDHSPRILEVEKADRTGSNEYVIVRITRRTARECEWELEGQLSDGLFENHRYGEVVEI